MERLTFAYLPSVNYKNALLLILIYIVPDSVNTGVIVGGALKPGMTQLCNNVMGHLNTRGLYQTLQVKTPAGYSCSQNC